MIHYQLLCSDDHAFDGWFKDSTSFAKQAKQGMLECPICGTAKVRQALMAPAIPRKGRAAVAPAAPVETPAQPSPGAVATGHMPDHVRAMMQRLRAEVEKSCDYVGDAFAEEARRIHRGESDRRGIYGETSPDEAEALADEGIDIAAIPWVPRADG
jgi:hypothetical protein